MFERRIEKFYGSNVIEIQMTVQHNKVRNLIEKIHSE